MMKLSIHNPFIVLFVYGFFYSIACQTPHQEAAVVADSNKQFKPNLLDTSDDSPKTSSQLDNMFNKYSSDGVRMSPTEFHNFLDHFVDLLRLQQKSTEPSKHNNQYHNANIQQDDHDSHDHDHKHEHEDHDHDHDHENDQHGHTHENNAKNQTSEAQLTCLKKKIHKIVHLNEAKNHSIDKNEFTNLIANVVAELDFCLCNETYVSMFSMKSNSLAASFKSKRDST
jgi:hypothetical protein